MAVLAKANKTNAAPQAPPCLSLLHSSSLVCPVSGASFLSWRQAQKSQDREAPTSGPLALGPMHLERLHARTGPGLPSRFLFESNRFADSRARFVAPRVSFVRAAIVVSSIA